MRNFYSNAVSIFSFIVLLSNFYVQGKSKDLTVIGYSLFSDGLGRLPIAFIDLLKFDLEINFIASRNEPWFFKMEDVPMAIQDILLTRNSSTGNVALMCDALWYKNNDGYKKVPNSKIKLAYSMIECNRIPSQWVSILNTHFDAVIVPDKWLVEVYINSGVKIPIFILPIPLFLNDFLNIPLKDRPNQIFTFGVSASFSDNKNQLLLLEAFAQEFGNDPAFSLKFHGRCGDSSKINLAIKKNKLNNVFVIEESMKQSEYMQFLKSLDCYVLLSCGEGFSITPREALALGIPCILSNNTAHRTICDSGCVRSVSSHKAEQAHYELLGGFFGGYRYNCSINEARIALRDVYSNYSKYLKKAGIGKEWVKQYLPSNLNRKFINLIKPNVIFFGNENKVENNYIITNSKSLYDKYLELRMQRGAYL